MCTCSLLLGNSHFKGPYLIAQVVKLCNYKVGSIDRPTTNYSQTVLKCSSFDAFPQSDNYKCVLNLYEFILYDKELNRYH